MIGRGDTLLQEKDGKIINIRFCFQFAKTPNYSGLDKWSAQISKLIKRGLSYEGASQMLKDHDVQIEEKELVRFLAEKSRR